MPRACLLAFGLLLACTQKPGSSTGDGKPSGPTSDGLFTVTLREFFLNFETLRVAVMPKT